MVWYSKMAEREGFEPSVPRKRDNGSRDRPVRPLRHLSAELYSIRAKNKTDRNPDGATHRRSLLPIYCASVGAKCPGCPIVGLSGGDHAELAEPLGGCVGRQRGRALS